MPPTSTRNFNSGNTFVMYRDIDFLLPRSSLSSSLRINVWLILFSSAVALSNILSVSWTSFKTFDNALSQPFFSTSLSACFAYIFSNSATDSFKRCRDFSNRGSALEDPVTYESTLFCKFSFCCSMCVVDDLLSASATNSLRTVC